MRESSKPLQFSLTFARKKCNGREYLVHWSVSDRLGNVVRHFLEGFLLSSDFVFSKVEPDRKEPGDSLIDKF